MVTPLGVSHTRRVTLIGAPLEQAVHRGIDLASPFGMIRLLAPTLPGVREFLLELGERGSQRLRWTFKSVGEGTELTITRPSAMSWLTTLRRPSAADLELERKLNLLPHLLNLKIAVLGGGTGLYATLLGLRDRTSSLTAVISGLPRPSRSRDPKDELGSLPRDNPGICLVALTPTVQENVVLRKLLEHRLQGGEYRGAHFGTLLLEALSEMRGSAQAALEEAGHLLAIRGRIILALDREGRDAGAAGLSLDGSATEAISKADMVVVAPGHLELDILPLLTRPPIAGALRESCALKIVVTSIMTAEGDSTGGASSSDQVRALARDSSTQFDIVLANSASFSRSQLQAYAARGTQPILPDAEQTAQYAKRVITEELTAPGDLARHDPKRLGECLIEIGSASLLNSEALAFSERMH